MVGATSTTANVAAFSQTCVAFFGSDRGNRSQPRGDNESPIAATCPGNLRRTMQSTAGKAAAAISARAVTAPPADPQCLVPAYCKKVSAGSSETDEEHRAKCTSPASCKRCGFWFAFTGTQFGKKSGQLLPPLLDKAFKRRFTFVDPLCGKKLPWLCARPTSWGGAWAWGCIPCNRAGVKSTVFGRVDCRDSVTSSACKAHESKKVHQRSVAALQAPQPDAPPEVLAVSATSVSECAPRLDRWVKAAGLVEDFSSFKDFERQVDAGGVGNIYDNQDKGVRLDSSRQVATRILVALAAPYAWRDLEVLGNASTASIGCDERDGLLLVGARCMVRQTSEIYDCLLASVRHLGTTPEEVKGALEDAVKGAFTLRVGMQRVGKQGASDEKKETQKTTRKFKHACDAFRSSVRTGLADGGNTEQRALFETSRSAPTPANAANPFFGNLSEIARDTPHKWRSIQKGIWNALEDDLQHFLGELVSADGSLSRMLNDSKKYQKIFQDMQGTVPVEARAFARILVNLSHSEARFDSRSEPLFRLFKLLPVTFAALERLCEVGDRKDVKHASALLARFGGPEGYDRAVSAAVVGDTMLVMQEFINLSQATTDDVMLTGTNSDMCKTRLRSLLQDGAIWLPEVALGPTIRPARRPVRDRPAHALPARARPARARPARARPGCARPARAPGLPARPARPRARLARARPDRARLARVQLGSGSPGPSVFLPRLVAL